MGGGNALRKLLASLGDDFADDAIKYGTKMTGQEMRNSTVNKIADSVMGGVDGQDYQNAMNLLRKSPILARSETTARTAARNIPEYQNVAVTNLDMIPAFGRGLGGNETILDPELLNRAGQKAFSLEDTAWQAPKGMNPVDAQNRFFVGESGGQVIPNSREYLQDIAWGDDALNTVHDFGWSELNAPISNKDVLAKRDWQPIPDRKLRDDVLDDIYTQRDNGRQAVMDRINKYVLGVGGIVPTAGVLSQLFNSQSGEQA